MGTYSVNVHNFLGRAKTHKSIFFLFVNKLDQNVTFLISLCFLFTLSICTNLLGRSTSYFMWWGLELLFFYDRGQIITQSKFGFSSLFYLCYFFPNLILSYFLTELFISFLKFLYER